MTSTRDLKNAVIKSAITLILLAVGHLYGGELRIRYFRSPEYPWPARERNQSGEVLLEVTVDRTGKVKEVVIRGSPPPVLADAARQAISKWRFSPPATVVRKEVAVRYRLSDVGRDPCYINPVVKVDLTTLEVNITDRFIQKRGKQSLASVPPSARREIANPPIVDQGLELVHFVSPHYPNVARKLLQSGDVKVTFKVDTEGSVYDISAKGAHPLLEEAARETLSQWRYERSGVERRGVVFFHYGFSEERRECDWRTIVSADLPDVWTITTDAPPPNEGTVAPQ